MPPAARIWRHTINIMQGKTHFVAGTATALAIMKPDTIPMLVIGTVAAGIGGILPDIDVGSSHAAKGVAKAVTLTIIARGLIFGADYVFHTGILDHVRNDGAITRMVAGYIGFLTLCGVGGATEHRSMTHSFLYALFATACVYIIYPGASLYFLIGYLSHLALDFTNKMGEQLLWPMKETYKLGWFRSDGTANKILLWVLTIATVWLIVTNQALRTACTSTDVYRYAVIVGSLLRQIAMQLAVWIRSQRA